MFILYAVARSGDSTWNEIIDNRVTSFVNLSSVYLVIDDVCNIDKHF